jgi:hypothetical protein
VFVDVVVVVVLIPRVRRRRREKGSEATVREGRDAVAPGRRVSAGAVHEGLHLSGAQLKAG